MHINHDEEFSALYELEVSLWVSQTRFDQAYMDRLLSPDFFEFGRSGRIYKREETLAVPSQEIPALLPLEAFTLHPVSKNSILVTYISRLKKETLERANRASLWVKTDEGWQLRFHQGTPLP